MKLPAPICKYDGLITALLTGAVLGLSGWVVKAEGRMSGMEEAVKYQNEAIQRIDRNVQYLVNRQ